MSGFFGKLKQAFTTKQPPKFKIHEASELKMIAMRTRVVLQTRMAQLLKHITMNDQQFKYVGQDSSKIYNILQLIGQKVIEVQTIKILIEMMRKVQNLSPQIVRTNGDIAQLRKELIWFQCVLWFRKSREIDNLQQLNKFCWDFFKGVDIMTELDLKCEVFQIYPVLKYLKKGEVLPLREVLFYIQPYVSCNIQHSTLDSVFKINTEEIKKKIDDNPNSKHNFSSSIPQNQGSSSQIQNQNFIPQNQTNYSNIKPQNNTYTPYIPPAQSNKPYSNNPYQSNSGNIGNYQHNNQNNQFYPNNSNYNNPNYFNNNSQQQQTQRRPDYPQNYNNFNQPTNSYSNPSSNFNPYNQNNISNNTVIKPQTQNISNLPKVPQFNPNISNTLNVNANVNKNTSQNTQSPQSIVKPQAGKPIQQKQSFYNSLLRVNSNTQKKIQTQQKIEPVAVDKPLNINYNNQRQIQNDFHQQFQSTIPFIQQNKEALAEDDIERQIRELEQIQANNQRIEQEKEVKRRQNERKQKQLREQQEREQQQRKQLQAQRLILQQLRLTLLEQQKRLKEQEKGRQQQEARRREQQQRRIDQQQRKKQQQLRIQKEEQERREREEQQREKQYQARRLQRQQEERQSSEIQLNVFADNEREEVDRGFSNRFTSTIGMKIDFGQNEGEQFNFQSPQQVRSSILRFSKVKEDKQQQEQKQSEADIVVGDEQQSVKIIEQFSNKSTPSTFKLFYFKVMQPSP